jgi:hypothetical protein
MYSTLPNITVIRQQIRPNKEKVLFFVVYDIIIGVKCLFPFLGKIKNESELFKKRNK